jgi:hypothetical protein
MNENEFRTRVDRQVQNATAGYLSAKRAGVAPQSISIPTYATQQDFDGWRIENAGSDFTEENKFAQAVADGLKKASVPVCIVNIRTDDFNKWRGNRAITPELRAEYLAEAGYNEWMKEQN